MTDETRHESADLEDYETDDPYDTLDGPLGDDPLDRGVAPPERWSAGIRYGTTADEQERGESLDQLLAEEEPDAGPEIDDDDDEEDEELEAEAVAGDEDVAEEDVDGLLLDDGPDPRAGRLVGQDEDGYPLDDDGDLVARDVGVDGAAASAEEAAVHVVDEDDYDIRSDG
jgi:hypothetical protein